VSEEDWQKWREGVEEYRRECDEELGQRYGLTEPLVQE
jgi:hypothetical protein